ncbi:MAG: hypothetical protein AB7P03_06975 [Kofleriaceae bacterium]
MRACTSAAVVAVIACGVGACERDAPRPRPSAKRSDIMAGPLVVDRVPHDIAACQPGHTDHVFVEAVTDAGVLRFDQQKLYWRSPGAPAPGQELTCERLDRSWGGGTRKDGTSYWRGWLDVVCAGPPRIEGKLKLDCGGITAKERFELDKNARAARTRGSAG